jgi:NodT family efflux transporter outer membrane factor (OMF) lipoprotein
VAEQWTSAANPKVQARQLQDGQWWAEFKDPILDSLIRQAYEQNLNLRVAATRVLQARGQQAIAVGTLFPQTQQATTSYSRTNISSNSANNPGVLRQFVNGLGPSIYNIPEPLLPTNYYSTWSAGFNMSWELDLWGRLRRSIETSNANLDSSVENYDDALVTLIADVATNYVQFRVAQQRIKIALDNVRIQEGVVKLVEERFKVGTGNRLNVEQARTVLAQTRASVPALRISLAQANFALCTLLGIPPHELETTLGVGPELGSNPILNTPDWVAVGVPADLVRRRPDVRGAERQVAAQSAQIGVAEADLYPSLYVDGMLGLQAVEVSRLFTPGSFFGTIMPNFRWNILNYGRVLNNVRVQDTHMQELIATYQNLVLRAAQEVEFALVGFLQSRQQAEALKEGVTAATSATKLGIQQFVAGTADFNRVFNLETTQVQVQDQLAVAQGNVALDLISAYRAVGGGWQLRCPAGSEKEAVTHEELDLSIPPRVLPKDEQTESKPKPAIR